jgi:hypothetical protein
MVATFHFEKSGRQYPSHYRINQSINQSDDGAKILHEIADPIHHLHSAGVFGDLMKRKQILAGQRMIDCNKCHFTKAP